MLNVKIPQFDYGYREQFTIYSDGRQLSPKDLTDLKARLIVWDSPTSTVINKELQIAGDPTSGIVYWLIEQGETNVFGNFKAEIQLYQEQEVELQPQVVMVYSTMQFNLQIIPSWQGGQS